MKKNYESFPVGPTRQGQGDSPLNPYASGKMGGNGGGIHGADPIKIALPDHLFPPAEVQTLDARNLFDVAPGATVEIIRFTAPVGGITRITKYGIFNDGLLASDFDFFPTVNGKRVYPFHGDPLDNFRIYLGVSAFLDEAALLPGLLDLQPNQVLRWTAQNRSAVTTTMGVRVTGFIDRNNKITPRFGG